MATNEINLAPLDNDIGFLDVGSIVPNRFNFPTFQDNTCFIFFFDEVVVESFFVLNNTHGN
jgi:hypothetical protein